jgi:nucleoside-triphosphatase THEP1
MIGLLTGPVGIGKTTLAERVVDLARRQGLVCGGLLTPALIDSCGQKAGIWGVDIQTGERRIMARADRDLGGPAIGPYSFDAAALAWAIASLEGAAGRCDLLLVDEIGKLELWHDAGLAPFLPWLASGRVGRALVLVRASLLAELQDRLQTVPHIVFQIDESNRGTLATYLLERLLAGQQAEGGASGGKI